MEKRLSDKLEEFSGNRVQPQKLLNSRDRPTEILQVNEVSPILRVIEQRIRLFEQAYSKKSGFLLGIICAAILSFSCVASEIYIGKLPVIEVLFIIYLVSFLFNYFLIRDGEVLPYIDVESDNFTAKISGLSSFASMILFVYSF